VQTRRKEHRSGVSRYCVQFSISSVGIFLNAGGVMVEDVWCC
jgi:hypothetical protein